MGAVAQPMDIAPSSFLSRTPSYQATCAFPSWPQRSSLGESGHEQRATSYLSDDDLFPQELEDDTRSISSASSNGCGSPHLSHEELFEMQREQAAMQREALRFMVLAEKEKRKQHALQRQRRGSNGSKKSPRSKPSHMAPISEAVE